MLNHSPAQIRVWPKVGICGKSQKTWYRAATPVSYFPEDKIPKCLSVSMYDRWICLKLLFSWIQNTCQKLGIFYKMGSQEEKMFWSTLSKGYKNKSFSHWSIWDWKWASYYVGHVFSVKLWMVSLISCVKSRIKNVYS